MHSDEIKSEIAKLRKEMEEIEQSFKKNNGLSDYNWDRMKIIEAKIRLLETDAINELNWSFYYAKEELKHINKNLQRML